MLTRETHSEMATYSKEDFDGIALAIRVNPLAVAGCRNDFEAAAAWYRSDCSTPQRVPPSTIKRQAKAIANAAEKLLGHLKVYDYRNASKGPSDLALLEALTLAEDGCEAEVIGATERVGRLVAIFEAIDAAQELQRRASTATNDATQRARLTTLRGRRGNPALRAWIAEMMPIHKKLTGQEPRISINAHRKPTGPFWRFLQVASQPLDIDDKKLASGVREKLRASVKRASLQK